MQIFGVRDVYVTGNPELALARSGCDLPSERSTSAGKSIVCGALSPGAGIVRPAKVKLHEAFDGFISPVPANAIFTVQTPLLFGRIVTRGPRESSSVYSRAVQTEGVEEVNVIPLLQDETRPSVELTFANKNAPLIGTEFGAITFTLVD